MDAYRDGRDHGHRSLSDLWAMGAKTPWWGNYGGPPAKAGIPRVPWIILKKRYAKGEINKEDFERMKKDLLVNYGTEKWLDIISAF